MFRHLSIVILVLTCSLAGFFAPRPIRAQGEPRCFPGVPNITNCIRDRFLEYWEQNGELAVFGYPISVAANEVNRDTGQTYLTQWFERNRFELHPENRAPYDVLLGRLGDDRLRQQGRDWKTFPKAAASAAHYIRRIRPRDRARALLAVLEYAWPGVRRPAGNELRRESGAVWSAAFRARHGDERQWR